MDAFNDHGAGAFSVDLDDPQLSLIQPRRVLRWRVDGQDRFASYVDDQPRIMYDPETERPSVRVEGPGLAGWLGVGKGGVVVWPFQTGQTRATKRHWGWASHGYSMQEGGWHDPHSRGQQRNPTPLLPRLVGEPHGWPDGRAEWLWGQPLTEAGGSVYDPAGFMLLRRNLPATSQGPARIYVVGTNEWVLYYDGEEVGRGGGFRNVREFDVWVPGGAQVPIAAMVSKVRREDFQWDAGALMITMRRLDEDGEPAGTMFRTYTPGVYGSGNQAWRALADPDPIPGVTPGRVLRPLIDEAKTRGAIPGLTPTFTLSNDSNGDPWAVDTINVGFDIGSKVYAALQTLAQDYGIEWRVRPGGQLDVFNALGSSRLGSLGPYARGSASGEGVRATRLLGATEGGYTSAGLDPLGVGRIEDFVELGFAPGRQYGQKQLERYLEATSRGLNEYDFELSGSSPRPYVDFGVGDEYEDGRVTQIVMDQEDAAGAVRWAVSLRPTSEV